MPLGTLLAHRTAVSVLASIRSPPVLTSFSTLQASGKPQGERKQRQKASKQGGNKKRHTSPPPKTPLEAFFAPFAPDFRYNPKVSASWEFYRLCNAFGWVDKENPRRKAVHQKFKDALVRQFNTVYGTNVNDLASWQGLCHVVRIDPIPDELHACREAVYYSFVNLVDLVDTKTTFEEVQTFESECALSAYTIKTGKFFPRDHAEAGTLLKYLLRHILHPREGYDVTRGGGGGGKRSRKRTRRR